MAESNTQPTEPRLEEESDVNMADETRLSTQEVPTPTITITNPTTDVEEPTISSLTSAPPILAEMIISPSSAPTDSSSPSNNPEQAIASSSTDTSTGVRVFNPSETTSPISTPSELDDSFFESTLSDVQAHHASVVSRSKRLNDAPLLTSKHRDVEKERNEKKKAEKWPSTTIRVKFSDGTQVQSSFPSSCPIQPVYAFVRTCLDPSASSKPFTLWQPPKYSYPEHPLPTPITNTKKRPLSTNSKSNPIVVPANYGPVRGAPMAGLQGGTGGKETLAELGLVPQSVLMIRWNDDDMNVTGYPAPLLPELRQKAEPLPSASTHRAEQRQQETSAAAGESKEDEVPKERKIPKWLQKGLLKKK